MSTFPRRFVVALIALVAVVDGAAAAGRCLSAGDAAEAVGASRALPPGQAVGQVRKAVPDAEILRAVLCRDSDILVYRIMVLRRDGRLIYVTVDATSGKVAAGH